MEVKTDIKIEVKIKLNNKTEIILSDEQAKKLYLKLKEMYDTPVPSWYPIIYPEPRKWWEGPWYSQTVSSDSSDFDVLVIR